MQGILILFRDLTWSALQRILLLPIGRKARGDVGVSLTGSPKLLLVWSRELFSQHDKSRE